jgi:HAD superfamily hydrolase (TIGR01484 family)
MVSLGAPNTGARPGGPTMVVTDLDGTLLDGAGQLGDGNRAALERLGAQGVVRVVATGRSLYSARLVLPPDFPIDYLAFASGAGICTWPDGELLVAHHLMREELERAAACLHRRRLDFMLHLALPDSHHFLFRRGGGDENPDFERRLERYRAFATPYPAALAGDVVASQFVAIEPARGESQHEAIAAELAELNVVLTTSPLDAVSPWTEIFPARASKSRAAAWLCERAGIGPEHVIAVGNDWNDRDLLAWAGRPHVVANAPDALRARYPVVAAHDQGGFAQAVAKLLA